MSSAVADHESSADGGPALFRLVRFWSRRWLDGTGPQLPEELRHTQHIQVVEAVAAGTENGAEATVGTIAHLLGLDHSAAGRMVRDAGTDGYVSRTESTVDQRRTALRLTPRGTRLLTGAQQWQRRIFTELTADWSDEDRDRFAGYLHRLGAETER
ncbi:MarR family winged helix-turn-helix transcriptional regulator [Nocardia asteroides]|uniref:MarR family winged helix-turn-helix transcriptional regulator n=1 Tax=Nocardia asteroides TaxID=1824 RepID=UPI001E6152E8|nr:MarR family transcriptional regulator [Nocardia asteroides]UGT64595.1 MarR family transcriptional regulator [Nocardia asteroides]